MKRKAFTMLELVMVIVVMGIVASIGAEIVAKLYENYIKTRAINRLQAQTELVLDQIAMRLQYRIKDSVRAIQPGGVGTIALSNADDTYNVIEWIGASNESFMANGWSGFIDLDSNDTNATPRTLKTTGSDLNITNDIVNALTYGNVSLNPGPGDKPAIIFKGTSRYNVDNYYNAIADNHTLIIERNPAVLDRFTIPIADDNVTDGEIFEQYYLSHSAFAIVPNPPNSNDFNLTLRYNYQPWEGESYVNDGNTSVLVEHASTFRFAQFGETIRVKLCIHDNNQSGNYDFSFCKERVIY
ncbi:prepilin-type N-terminal cleavage/methylation domain-containing protein [Sulfurospirillum arcachonense]|uniref:prepilin-type N-terminal cleavage/methylation domain-containing protein n=1 Tax=Sulfurospirillum arcachonense TaxID=57666 RepID=UPI0004696350|nr:prepilin-type N-terminal cleavage/methylation domain-containing protein [Sulfurospirillum arcachonense]